MEQLKNKQHFLPLFIFISCLAMFWVEVFWQPGYFFKSIVKIGCFLLLPWLYCHHACPQISLKFCHITAKKQLRTSLYWGISVFGLIMTAYFLFATFIDLPQIAAILEENLSVNKENFLWVAIYISCVNSFLEEFFFRGIAYFPLVSIFGSLKAAFFSSAIFSLYHVAILLNWFTWPIFFLILFSLFCAGLFFIQLDQQQDTIYPSWFVHGCANLSINTIGCLMFGIL